MKKILILVALLSAMVPTAFAARRAAEDTPIVTLKSSAFEQYGGANKFHLVIGGRAGAYIDVDCGFGPTEVELQPANIANGAVQGAMVTCTVSEAGTVKIYGDAADIDYFEAEGCYLRSADISQLSELNGLNLMHNELTGLDLTPNTKLQTIQLSDNPFSAASPLKIGAKPELLLLDISLTQHLDPAFDMTQYPKLVSFDAFSCETLFKLDPSKCPQLQRLTADVTPIQSLDVTHNYNLEILNIADTRITSIDVSKCPNLLQLYLNHDSHMYSSYKISSLDVTHNPKLIYLFCANNNISSLDLSQNIQLMDLYAARNQLSEIDLSNNKLLINVNIANNNMGFANLPINTGDWNEYYYKQRPTKVNRSYKVGDVIDLSAKMLREGTITTCKLMKKNEEDFSNPIPVDPSLYKYEAGRMTLLAALPDSVFLDFGNDRFPDETLTTTHFMVKTAEDFGADNVVISFMPGASKGETVSFRMKAFANDIPAFEPKFDFGDGTLTTLPDIYAVNDGYMHISAPRTGGGYVRVVFPEGADATAFLIENQRLYSLNITGAPELRELAIVNAGLTSLDLSKHRCLQTLRLSGNRLTNFSLSGKNMNYAKTTLTRVEIADNQIANFTFDGLESLDYIDISNNKIAEIELGSAKTARSINVSRNQLTSINLAKCDALMEIDMSSNLISSVVMPEISMPVAMNISDNCMTLANLSEPELFKGRYVYAPQKPMAIPAKGPGVNLASQLRLQNGAQTVIKWVKADGTPLQEGTHYTISKGVTRFLDDTVGEVHAVITHGAFPDFKNENVFTTTNILVTPMPTNVVAQFATLKAGETIRVALAAEQDNTSFFFDWTGDGSQLSMYEIGTTYSEFYETTAGKAVVKVYAYDNSPELTVFSISGASLASADVSKLSKLTTLNLSNTGLSNIIMPQSAPLRELFLDGCNITNNFDLTPYQDLYYLTLNKNKLSGEYDFSKLPNLQILGAADNNLTSVKLGTQLWGLDLSRNAFETIDLAQAPALEQVGLSGNMLSTLDVSRLYSLKSLYIDNNRFTFSTLPPASAVSIRYIYRNQAPLQVEPQQMSIDLSKEAFVGDSITTYRWFFDEFAMDENGNYVGEELVAGEEYTVKNGVTTFLQDTHRVIGLLLNPAYPDLALSTVMTDVVSNAVEAPAVAADAVWSADGMIYASPASEADTAVYDAAGIRVASARLQPGTASLGSFAPGIYFVTLGQTTHKIVVF